MAENPPLPPDQGRYVDCPYCTIQVPADATVCPHCRKALPPSGAGAPVPGERGRRGTGRLERLPRGGRLTVLSDLWILHGKWIKAGTALLAAIVLLFLVYRVRVGYEVRVVDNPALPVIVEQEKKSQSLLLKVFVTNKGEDVPDLSLKSVGVVMEFVYRDGRRERKTVFPKAEFRGEGALLHGETGSIEIETPTKELKEVVLRSEVVDLGAERMLIPPGGRRRVVPGQR
jgi:hypothetical protein